MIVFVVVRDRVEGVGGVGGFIFELLLEFLLGERLIGWLKVVGWGG